MRGVVAGVAFADALVGFLLRCFRVVTMMDGLSGMVRTVAAVGSQTKGAPHGRPEVVRSGAGYLDRLYRSGEMEPIRSYASQDGICSTDEAAGAGSPYMAVGTGWVEVRTVRWCAMLLRWQNLL